MERTAAIAHRRDRDELTHGLEEHLHATACMAKAFAAPFNSGEWAYLAGLWHDLGKYQPAFQRYIGAAGNAEAHEDSSPGRVDHSIVGAIHALERFCQEHFGKAGRILAYLIAGHHTGLADWESGEPDTIQLAPRLNKRDLWQAALAARPPNALLEHPLPVIPQNIGNPSFWIRMLFSCLVDADFLDTESFMEPKKAEQRTGWQSLAELTPRFDEYMGRLRNDTPLNKLRSEIQSRCRKLAAESPGLFSLSVPTGGGKTLASMAFALEHARLHGKGRVIYAIPYTSIIEQTADIFRNIFGADAVLEHHSNLEPARHTEKYKPAAQNWDVPIVVTTNVQLFESLFAARTSRVRKLHNLVDSVIVLDEAQLLPVEFLIPVLNVIEDLAANYGVSFVLSTATQPALGERETPEGKFPGLKNVRELVESPAALAEQLKRVEIVAPDLSRPVEWPELAGELARHESVLCIVNRRDDAATLARLMPPGTYHLSARMCGRHRSVLIRWIRRRMGRGLPTRVISTQLVEAGVDLDFPVVYRALAGLDSIAQAAGRCNREDRLSGRGRVVVFVPPTEPPPGILKQGADISRQLFSRRDFDPLALDSHTRYFEELFWRQGPDQLDKKHIMKCLEHEPELHYRFATAAKRFQLIETAYETVIVRNGGKSRGLIERLITLGPNRPLLAQLQRFTVNLPPKQVQEEVRRRTLIRFDDGIYLQVADLGYDTRFGFIGTVDNPEPEDLMV